MKQKRKRLACAGLCLLLLLAGWGAKPAQAAEPGPEALVLRLYRQCLGREPREEETAFWTERLETGAADGAQVVTGFFWSEEYSRKNPGPEEYVLDLYRSVLGREPSAEEAASWLEWLELGLSREFVLGGFVGSAEFGRFCAACGVEAGQLSSSAPRDQNPEAARLIQRAYRTVLGRTGGPEELDSWAQFLLSGGTGAQLAAGFLMSQEYQRRPVSLNDYVDLLYALFLDRLPDAAGKADWIQAVREGRQTPASLIACFAGSAEFQRLCARYGIASGAGLPVEGSVSNVQTGQPEPPGEEADPEPELAPELRELANRLRRENGLGELEASQRLDQLALRRAGELSRDFSHQGHEGGENIARSTSASISAEEIFQGWASSQGHRENLLAQGYRYTGGARYVTAEGDSFWVQVFSSQP